MNILVTGGSSGLGASILKKLVTDNKFFIYFTYTNSRESATQTESTYRNSKAVHCDFLDNKSVDDLVNQIKDYDLDILINNAATAIHKEHFYKTEPALFLQSFEYDIVPTLKITQEALKTFRRKKFGKIINIISSAVVNHPPVGWSSYVANKAYLLSMSKSWVVENSRFNISSNNISPSFMQTGLTSDTDERIIEQMIEGHPL